ncbi:MAG: hypothetical protein ACHP85_04060 [Burkholderiales bacterium]
MSPMRRAWSAVLLASLLPTAASAETLPARPRRTPIRDSVDRVIDRVVLAHLGPCQLAGREGVPCFPIAIDRERRYSVADSMRSYRGTGAASPSVPTTADIQGQMSGAPQSASGGVGFDPVCTVKNLVKKLSGNATTYYLYKTWDARGERPMMTDHKLEPFEYQSSPGFRFEYLGSFDSECAAVAAWNKALRDAVDKKPEAEGPPQ